MQEFKGPICQGMIEFLSKVWSSHNRNIKEQLWWLGCAPKTVQISLIRNFSNLIVIFPVRITLTSKKCMCLKNGNNLKYKNVKSKYPLYGLQFLCYRQPLFITLSTSLMLILKELFLCIYISTSPPHLSFFSFLSLSVSVS